jgi:hypothetical protein
MLMLPHRGMQHREMQKGKQQIKPSDSGDYATGSWYCQRTCDLSGLLLHERISERREDIKDRG